MFCVRGLVNALKYQFIYIVLPPFFYVLLEQVIQNIDDLFERDELSAAPDPGWPDCFNSGVFVFVPNQETYEKLLKFAMEIGSFDGGDQVQFIKNARQLDCFTL